MTIPASELIINGDGSAFHIHIRPDQLADIVILVGDPGRTGLFRPLFDGIECSGSSREFNWITGLYNGKRVTVLSTGIGTDNIDIVMTELDALANVDFKTREVKPDHKSLTILRIGTTGAIQPDIPIGTFIFTEISIGTDGLMNWYAGRDNICLTDYEEAFKAHVHWDRHLPDPYFVKSSAKLYSMFEDCTYRGMTIAAPGFYGPQGRVVRQQLAMPDMLEDYESFCFEGRRITNFEMESSALAGMAAQLGHEAATVCCAIANRHHKSADTDYKRRFDEFLKTALDRLTA